MAAYAALVSVMQIIHQIQNHPSPPISLDKQQVESLIEIVAFLQEFLEGYKSPVADSDEADPLEMRIADAAYAVEDVIESETVGQIIPPQTNKMATLNCFQTQKLPKNDGEKTNIVAGLKKVIEGMDFIKKEVMEIVKEKAEVQDQLQRQVSASASLTRLNNFSRSSLSRLNNTMVGFDDVSLEIMDKLTDGLLNRQVIPIVGMSGIGKTTLARNIYTRPFIKDHFDISAWTTISQKHNTKEILCKLLSQANEEGSDRLSKMSEDKLGLALYQYLTHRRFLIVLDDIWSIEAWENMQQYFPNNCNGSRILVTTRLSNLGSQLNNNYSLEMKFLDEESSWMMFSQIVFKGGSCPLELEKIGKKIVKSCKGLPLSIVVIGGLLEKLERTKKCWKSIRRNLNSVVNSENDQYCFNILKMSYNHLPLHLKPCFLYMGVFEEDHAIRVSSVIKLWVSEGFLKPISDESLETTGKRYLQELVDRNLIIVQKLGSNGSAKYFKVHDLLRDLCLRESHKERFYHVLGKHSPRSTCNERCIVIPSGISKNKVINALKSRPCARSYVSDSERVRLLPNLRLLRTLKASDSYYYQKHRYSLGKMFQIVNLRFLAVGAHRYAKFPSSINQLWNLQTLIISGPIELVRHPRKKSDACIDIWKMPLLRHVQFYTLGLHLRDPVRQNDIIMENLQTLIGVRGFKCDEEVVRRIPNIKKLAITYDNKVKRNESLYDHYCLQNMECLHKLESLSCNYHRFDGYSDNLSFPHSLKKLSLDMFYCDYEAMFVSVGSLPLLQKLSLKFWSFFGTWEVTEGQFPSLKFLSLKHFVGLQNWTTESSPFPCLEHLHLDGLQLLKEIPTEMGEIPTLQSIVLKNCNASVVKSVKKIVEYQEELQGDDLAFKVEIFLREDDEELQNLANHNFQFTVSHSFDFFV